jgi:hypothetical protein
MELEDKLDLISKRVDVLNKKITILLIVSGAIWIYGIKSNGSLLFLTSVFLFLISSIFLLINFLSLNDLDKTLKELENE